MESKNKRREKRVVDHVECKSGPSNRPELLELFNASENVLVVPSIFSQGVTTLSLSFSAAKFPDFFLQQEDVLARISRCIAAVIACRDCLQLSGRMSVWNAPSLSLALVIVFPFFLSIVSSSASSSFPFSPPTLRTLPPPPPMITKHKRRRRDGREKEV